MERQLVVGVVPLLCRKIAVTLPDLHANAVRWARAGVEAEVGTVQLDLGATPVDHPVLSGGTIAIKTG